MSKRVVVIASRETGRRALPHFVRALPDPGIVVSDVRIPPSNRTLDPGTTAKLIKAGWHEIPDARPDKFVAVMDLDGANPDAVLRPFREQLSAQMSESRRPGRSRPAPHRRPALVNLTCTRAASRC